MERHHPKGGSKGGDSSAVLVGEPPVFGSKKIGGNPLVSLTETLACRELLQARHHCVYLRAHLKNPNKAPTAPSPPARIP